MLAYIIKRLLHLIPVMLVLSLVVFIVIKMIPGDPVMIMLGANSGDVTVQISPEVYNALRQQLGLDQPVYVQYFKWLWRILHGDFGVSMIAQQPVLDIIISRVPATFYLAVISFLFGALIAIPLGILSAVKKNTIIDYLCSSLSIIGISIPNFWLGLLLILLFSINMNWLPSMGYISPWQDFRGFLTFALMPTIVLGTNLAAQVMRFTRSDMLDQMQQDYVRTARAKGLPERMVIYKHVIKNSMMSTVTALGMQVGKLLGGSTVVEVIFSWPGLSRLLMNGIFGRDYPVVQGTVLFLALIAVLANLIVDIMYKYLDPRVKLE